MDLNCVNLSGRVTGDPNGRRSGEGRSIATFRIAVERDREHVDFFKITCFDRLATSVLSYIGKSSRVIVTGRMAQRDQDRVEIIASDVHFLDGPRRDRERNRDQEPGDETGDAAAGEPRHEADPDAPVDIDPFNRRP